MRELIYVSQRKIRSFQDVRDSKFGLFRRVREAEIKVPFGGGAKLAFSDDVNRRYPGLSRITRHIDSLDRGARWYESETLEPGDWVVFETRMNYRIVDVSRSRKAADKVPVLLFWDVLGDEMPSTRLLLHGAAEHLMDQAAIEPPAREGMLLAPSSSYGFVQVLRALTADRMDGADLQHVPLLLRKLENGLSSGFAMWMTGFARVTANVLSRERAKKADYRTIVASPLYVELVPRP
ncbi:SAVMC3_10250 family protein [Amycolatopsis sp. A133]|uniref:SAVMC3_10250 family protein n=1 Tax=Amycolatopsis sp. A133 TaxID=3064472 RepID=UPI0037C105C5